MIISIIFIKVIGTMSRQISQAEGWEQVYKAYQQINFSAFDFATVKQALIDYFKLFHPEFNNYIETDEFIMIIEALSYISELYAYRLDVVAHENLLPTAQRKDSVLRLAKLISYAPSRNIPGRGLVKIVSISTTEDVIDSNGNNLANKTINWNDILNSNWKEQFILVLNRALKQNFGTVLPNDRVQVQDQIFELYTLNNIPLTNSVIKYTTTVASNTIPMELVSSDISTSGPYEHRPEVDAPFNILYGSDGLSDNSNMTGFFILTKQGQLQKQTATFDGITPNQTYDVLINNINDTDVWVNNVNTNTRSILDNKTVKYIRSGEWEEVDVAYAYNIIFNTNSNRNKYEVETLQNDNIRIIFGDGEFSNTPNGDFDIWYRTSNNSAITIPPTAILNLESNFTYINNNNTIHTLLFTFSLTTPIQNAAPSEDIEHIRKMAPAVYYSQDRMVNGPDYNSYMLQDQTILKLKSINRSFAGESQYMHWYDASNTYANVKIFGDDLSLYYTESIQQLIDIPNNIAAVTVINNYVEPLLSNIFTYIDRTVNYYSNPSRRYFTEDEKQSFIYGYMGEMYYLTVFNPPNPQFPVGLKYISTGTTTGVWTPRFIHNTLDMNWDILINREIVGLITIWNVKYKMTDISVESPTTKFWYNNNLKVVNYETLNSQYDTITLLKANLGNKRVIGDTNILSSDLDLVVIGQPVFDSNIQLNGLSDERKLHVVSPDVNNDGLPDNVTLYEIMNNTKTVTHNIVLNYDYYFLVSDIIVTGNVNNSITYTTDGNIITNSIHVIDLASNTSVTVSISDYVYFYRSNQNIEWSAVEGTVDTINNWLADINNINYKRLPGRYGLNFLWLHKTPRYHLVDPNVTNIIDSFIITRGHYLNVREWLDGNITQVPTPPTPQELKTSYQQLTASKMISDTLILHPGVFKIIFGPFAIPQLQAKFVLVQSTNSIMTINQIKLNVVESIRSFFDINNWDFGYNFNFTELVSKIHYDLNYNIDTVVLVPLYEQNLFGDLFQVSAKENEILIPSISTDSIEVVRSLNHNNIRQA
jgi:hypothetical protein